MLHYIGTVYKKKTFNRHVWSGQKNPCSTKLLLYCTICAFYVWYWLGILNGYSVMGEITGNDNEQLHEREIFEGFDCSDTMV